MSFVLPIALAAALGVSAVAQAQTCDFSLCPSGTSYTGGSTDASGPYGSCKHCNWFGYCSHTLNRCPAGSTLDLATGRCTYNICLGGCGGELPLCDADERYTGSGVSGGNRYGVCSRGPNGFGGYRSHQLKYCRPGWTLQTTTGMCRKDCAVDLTLENSLLLNASGGVVSSVRAFQPYFLCVDVANIGTAASGAFRVGAGGLAVSVAPVVSVAGLGASASTWVCLRYATTPPPGTYRVGVVADSTHLVSETNELNNGLTVTVPVVP